MNFSNSPFHGRRLNGCRDRGAHNGDSFSQEWRCQECGKLLGKYDGERMQIRKKPAEYLVSFPITAKCPGCGTLNVKNKS